MTLAIHSIRFEQVRVCEQILRALPEWFGIEEALVQYIRDTQLMPTWIAEEAGRIVGFVTLREHFPAAAEVHCIAVAPGHHRRGVGSALTKHVEAHCQAKGVQFLQVKTLGPSRASDAYAATRAFYEAMGFAPLEEFPSLWPGNPCLLLVKRL